MPIVSSQITGRNNKAVFMEAIDHIGETWKRRTEVPIGNDDNQTLTDWVVFLDGELANHETDAEAYRAKNNESNPAQYQTQPDLDRKTLAELMQIADALEFSTSLQWFRDFEVRAGANTNARAAYLGVPKAEYDLVATRYNQITGLVSGLNADAARVWELGSVW